MRKPVEFAGHPHRLDTVTYRGVVKHVVDGDTLDVLLDLGLNTYSYVTVRVRGVDTAELVGTEGTERDRAVTAKTVVAALVLKHPVLVTTYKDRQTFGRYVADVEYWDDLGVRHSLAQTLVEHGLGRSL